MGYSPLQGLQWQKMIKFQARSCDQTRAECIKSDMGETPYIARIASQFNWHWNH